MHTSDSGKSFEDECIEQAPAVINEFDNLVNAKKIVSGAALKSSSDADIATISAVTGWAKEGGGSDTGIEFQLALDITTADSINGGSGVFAAVFANADADTKIEVNEFNVTNLATANESVFVVYQMAHVDGTALSDTTGYTTITGAAST